MQYNVYREYDAPGASKNMKLRVNDKNIRGGDKVKQGSLF